jgi:hypothetical protein
VEHISTIDIRFLHSIAEYLRANKQLNMARKCDDLATKMAHVRRNTFEFTPEKVDRAKDHIPALVDSLFIPPIKAVLVKKVSQALDFAADEINREHTRHSPSELSDGPAVKPNLHLRKTQRTKPRAGREERT